MLFTPRERGQGLVEYAFILSLVVLIVLVVLVLVGGAIGGLWDNAVTELLKIF
jgi:pilus assembly protein Flp/PilA